MTNRFGYGLIATMATASIVLAGGEGEDKKGEKNKNTRTLERLANSPAPQGATLKAAPGKGFTVDLGDDFSINIQNRIQVRWTYANMELAGDTNNFAVNRLRTAMGGHVWDKDTTYGVQLEYAMGSLIRDAWLRRNFWTSEDGNMNVALRVGQFRGRHGLEYEGSSFELEHAARSISSRTFSGTRVLGARLEGSALEGGKLNWGIAAVNDDPALASFIAEGGGNVHGAANADNELNFLFDLRFDPMGAMDMSQGDLAHTEELMGTVGASVGRSPGGAMALDVWKNTSGGAMALDEWKSVGFSFGVGSGGRTSAVLPAGSSARRSAGAVIVVSTSTRAAWRASTPCRTAWRPGSSWTWS